jgi:lysophospholipase L1-like esterase
MLLRTLFLSTCFFLFSCANHSQPPQSFKNERVLILGDSITQAGDYVSFMEYYLNKNQPEENFDLISIGLSSETASGLSEKAHPFPRPCIHERIQRALDTIKPSLVFVCYGMNDGIYAPQSKERFDAYKKGIISLQEKIEASGAKVIFLTPPLFDIAKKSKSARQLGADDYSYKNPYTDYNEVLRDYGQWLMETSSHPVIDLNTPMLRMTELGRKNNNLFHLTKDGIHPNELGHLLIAQSILTKLKILSMESLAQTKLSDITQDPLFKLVAQRRQIRSKGWLEFIGYTRGKTVKSNSIDSTEVRVKELQTQIKAL